MPEPLTRRRPLCAAGGALEAVKEARSQGKVRAIGFSAHDEAAALRLIRSDEFDTVMFPLNFFSYTVGGFCPGGIAAGIALAGIWMGGSSAHGPDQRQRLHRLLLVQRLV